MSSLRIAPHLAASDPAIDRRLVGQILTADPVRVIHRNRRSTVAEVSVGGSTFARKTYRPRVAVLDRWGPSPARRTWRLLLEGHDRGLPLPEPIAFAPARRGHRAVVVTRWFAGDHLHKTHARERERLRDPAERARFASAVVDALVALFGAGMRTRDLAPQNLLVGRRGDGWGACLVDLDDVRLAGPPRPATIIESLAQLGHLPATVTARERLLGLRLFLERGGRELLAGWIDEHSERALRDEIAARVDALAAAKHERLLARDAAHHAYSGFGLDSDGNPMP